MSKFQYLICGVFVLGISIFSLGSYQMDVQNKTKELGEQIASTELIKIDEEFTGEFDGTPIPPQKNLPKTEITQGYSTDALVKRQQEIESLKGQIDALTKELYTANKEIDIYEQSITDKELSIDEKKTMAGYYLRAYYQAKKDASLQLGFLSADNYKDFLYRYSTTAEIMRRIENSIARDTEEEEELEKNKSAVNMKAALYENVLHDLEAKQADLVKKQAELNAFLKSHQEDLDVELVDAVGKLGGYIKNTRYNYTAARGSKFMILPVSGEVTSPWGDRIHPIYGDSRHHAGVDIGVDTGTPIKAAADGAVMMASWYGGYGKCVIINHGNGIVSLYGHNDKLLVKEGQIVQQGDVIALAGSTGNSTGPHCHFEVRKDGDDIDPYTYVIRR